MYENNLYEIRVSRGMTQKEFAEEIGMTAANYSRYERGANDIPLTVAKHIAIAFDVSIDQIAGLEEPDFADVAEGQAELEERIIEENAPNEERIRELIREELQNMNNEKP